MAETAYCEIERLKRSLPNNLFETSSLIDETGLEEMCAQIAGRMDTRFVANGHDVPLDSDYIDSILEYPERGGDGSAPGSRIMETVVLANIYGTRQLVFSALATDDDEASQLAEMNGDLYDQAMSDIISALSPRKAGIGPIGIGTRGRQPIVRLKDAALW